MDECIQPGTVADRELEAYLDGISSARVEEHLMRCRHCAAEVSQLRAISARLRRVLHRADCPSVDVLRAFRWGQLPGRRAADVERHLAHCAACAQEAASFQGPPEPASFAQALTQGIKLFVASLVDAPAAMAPALRGAAQQTAVYRVAETGWEVAVTVGTESMGFALSGQLLGPDAPELATARASALLEGLLVCETSLDESGWFDLRPLAPGRYALWIETAHARVQALDLRIGLTDS